MRKRIPRAHGNASKKKIVITYGTFDVLHIGHINLLRRARALGDYLIVGLSTDAFNALKHKEALQSFAERRAILEALRSVDKVIPERNWEQKKEDVKKYGVSVLAMGNDWKGEFDWMKKHCAVVYLPRTKNISSTQLRTQAAKRHIWKA